MAMALTLRSAAAAAVAGGTGYFRRPQRLRQSHQQMPKTPRMRRGSPRSVDTTRPVRSSGNLKWEGKGIIAIYFLTRQAEMDQLGLETAGLTLGGCAKAVGLCWINSSAALGLDKRRGL